MNTGLRKSYAKLTAAFAIVLVVIVLGVVSEAAVAGASQGFPLYSWGGVAGGRLGRPTPAANPSNRPARVVDSDGVARDRWIASSTAAGGSWAISTSGHLYAWGAAWDASHMGQDGIEPPAAFLSGSNINRPRRVGVADNWVEVASIQNFVVLLSSDGEVYRLGSGGPFEAVSTPERVQGPSNFVQISGGFGAVYGITDDGEIWVAGSNSNGILANGTTAGNSTSLVKVEGTADNWVGVSGRNTHAFAINSDGELFSWGNNDLGRTGRGTTLGTTTTPTQIGIGDDWIDVRIVNNAGVAINSDGEIFSWGSNLNGRTGQGVDEDNTLTPTQVGTANNWVTAAGGNQHILALNDDGELWGWGSNTSGQLGLGHSTSPQTTPQFIVQTYGFVDAAVGGGTHSMMLIRTTPAEGALPLSKALQKPQGTPVPDPGVSFTFNVVPYSFNSDTAAVQVALVPVIPLANRTVIIDDTGTTTDPVGGTPPAGGIITTTNSTDLLEGIEFSQPGRFAWRVTEVQTATGVGSDSEVTVFSQAEYEIAVYIQRHPTEMGVFLVAATTIYRLRNADNTVVDPPVKVNDLTFTNTYMRTTAGTTAHPGALRISKIVTGSSPLAPTTPFEFEVTLTRTALCASGTEFTGRVVNNTSNNPILAGEPPVPRVYTFTSGTTRTITLLHNQRLVFDELVVGTHFTVTERAEPNTYASVDLTVDGVPINVAPNETPNTALPIGNHLIGAERNSAAFTNYLLFAHPIGLNIADTTSARLLFLVAIASLALTTHRARKRIEELSVHCLK